MTPEQAKDNLEFIKAFAEGKKIEKWNSATASYNPITNCNFEGTGYRIKPEITHRPYTADEAKVLVGRAVIGKHTTHTYLITACYNPCGHLRINNETVTPKALLAHYTFTNGNPCGVLMEQ